MKACFESPRFFSLFAVFCPFLSSVFWFQFHDFTFFIIQVVYNEIQKEMLRYSIVLRFVLQKEGGMQKSFSQTVNKALEEVALSTQRST